MAAVLVDAQGRVLTRGGAVLTAVDPAACGCCGGGVGACNYYIKYRPCLFNGADLGDPHYLCPENDEAKPDLYIACDFRCVDGEWAGDGYPPALVKYKGWCYVKVFVDNPDQLNEDRYCKPSAERTPPGSPCDVYPPLPPEGPGVVIIRAGSRLIECTAVGSVAEPFPNFCSADACRCYRWHLGVECPCREGSGPLTYCRGEVVRAFARSGLVCGAGGPRCVACRSGSGGTDTLPPGAEDDGGGPQSCCSCCEAIELGSFPGEGSGCRRWSYTEPPPDLRIRQCCCSVDDEIVVSMGGSYFAVLSPGRTLTVTIRNGDFRLTRGVPHTVITEFRSSDGLDDSDRPQVYEFGDGPGGCGLGNYSLPQAFLALVAGDSTSFNRTTCAEQQQRVTWRADPNSGQVFNGQGSMTVTYAGQAGGRCRSGCNSGLGRPVGRRRVRTGEVDPARAAEVVRRVSGGGSGGGGGCGGCGGGGGL